MAQNLPKDFAKTAQNLHVHIICWIWMQQGRKAGSKKWIILQHIQVIQHQQLCIFVFFRCTLNKGLIHNFHCILSRCLSNFFFSFFYGALYSQKKRNIHDIKYQITRSRLITLPFLVMRIVVKHIVVWQTKICSSCSIFANCFCQAATGKLFSKSQLERKDKRKLFAAGELLGLVTWQIVKCNSLQISQNEF